MSYFDELKRPIHKGDLMPVIRQGIFMSFTGGLIIGAVQLVMLFTMDFTLTWIFLFLLSMMTAKRIRDAFQSYHVIFSILSVVFFMLAYYFMSLTTYTGLNFIMGYGEISDYISLLNPFIYFQFLNPLNGYFFSVENILQLVFFLIGTIYAYRYVK